MKLDDETYLIERPFPVSVDTFLLSIRGINALSLPGQFITIRIGKTTDPLLRRPFSIFDHDGGILRIIVQRVGKGTELLAAAEPGEVDILGPLGLGFTLPQGKDLLLIGGGVGNAPLFYLARELKKRGNSVHYVYGARSHKNIFLADDYCSQVDEIYFATDDGSKGFRGYAPEKVSQLLLDRSFDMIYTCGPSIMMRRVVEISKNIPVEVSVENYFGCGIGLCAGCTLNTTEGIRRACIDGPVFPGKTIRWDNLPD